MTNPLLELISTACELMNHSFAPPDLPASARLEFYHQFRKLWDRGIPVGMGLGHLLMKADGELLVIERIAEKGVAGEVLARIAFGEEDLPTVENLNCLCLKHDGNHWHPR